ncbi:FAD-dependent monooxygenase [Streptomyces sp. UNOB3_S3]|uniref:FAD-dependent monooxygenase n=1 Tax=Streptomyces sp. UNOB3_S3 TaxID=2871682 RepID=UPI001E2C6894|nr:FAD-dependent monooxygenase [Streptomyces sp. UNOB3_S3]MCC3773689.1 FAD-dependent monooxygenase [Streptomyces sp. UNOB3_S3]
MAHALIIGGGVAGPVAAMALRRAGLEATVYEAVPAGAGPSGSFLTLFANGLAALRAIGADGPVRAVSCAADTVESYSETGRLLGRRPMSGSGEAGLSPRTVPRAVLCRVLREEAARRGIHVEHGKRLVGLTTRSHGRMVASFADGTHAEGSLVIGADGIRSRVRALLDPAAPAPRHTGQFTVSGRTGPRTTVAGAEPSPPRTYRMYYGRGGFFGCTTAPDGSTFWFANVPGPELPRAALAAATPGGWRSRLDEVFAADRTPAAAIVAATGDDVVGVNCYDLPSTPVWHDERTVLIGDAAHATAPNAAQGASLAIEDGVVLARCLRDLPGTGRAFAGYERLRRERVERVVALSAALAGRRPVTAEERRARDAEVERRLARPGRPVRDWLTGYRIDWAAPVH